MIAQNIGNVCLSTLLPYKQEEKVNKDLITGFFQYIMLVKATAGALTCLKLRRFKQFDALVKENACQIRAEITAATGDKESEKVKGPLEFLENMIKEMEALDPTRIKEWIKKGGNLKGFLEANNWDAKLTEQQLFFVESYILAQVKVSNNSGIKNADVSNMNLLKVFDTQSKGLACIKPDEPYSATFLSRFEKNLLEKLSTFSVDYLLKLAKESSSEECKEYLSEKRIFYRFSYIRNLPMFWSYEILLQDALKRAIPLIFKVKEPSKPSRRYYFRAVPTKGYLFETPEKMDEKLSAIVVKGVCTGDPLRVLQYDPVEVILANAAIHKQYVDESKDARLQETEGWSAFKSKALKWGCTLDDQSLFFIRHVYCSTIADQIAASKKVKV